MSQFFAGNAAAIMIRGEFGGGAVPHANAAANPPLPRVKGDYDRLYEREGSRRLDRDGRL
jgi:hypothetical protein